MNAFRPTEDTMMPEEAQAVLRRHLERLPTPEARPSVSDVAEALRTTPAEVAAILAEVRAELPRLHAGRRKGRSRLLRASPSSRRSPWNSGP